jgi:hypothetical protein
VLQAWALVHNDTEEDWSRVKVELVNGRPTSFLYPLAAPRYGRRELAHPEDDLSTVPQLMGKTADALWGDFDEEGAGSVTGGTLKSVSIGLGSMSTSGRGAGGGGYGLGVGASGGSVASSVLGVGNLAETAQATGTESGALFSYQLPAPLDLKSHGSALVPFLQQPVELEVLAWLNAPGETAKAGVRLVNTTTQTLPAGPIAAFAGGGLAGEGGLDRLKPAQHQIVEYGVDPDVEVRLKAGSLRLKEQTRRLTFANDRLQEHYLRTTESVYVVENRSGQPRAIYLALQVVDNAKVSGADALDYDAPSSKPVAVWRLGPRQKVERAMKFEEGLSRPLAVSALTSERLQQLSTCTDLPEAERRAASDAMAAQKKVEETGKALAKVQAEASKVEKDLERLEGHLRAMGEKSAAPTGNPFVQRIVAAEDKLEDLRKKIEDLNTTAEAQRNAVRELLKKLGS